MSKLLIISHTSHYINDNGALVGWGSTVTEINHLALMFDEIYHIAVLQEGEAPLSAVPYTKNNIHFVSLPFTGGQRLIDKMSIIWNAPKTILKVFTYLKKVDIFQFRAPTGMGVYLIPILILFSNKKGWFKYAGNWNQRNAPLGYAIQRWFLKKQNRRVTINGRWDNQPKQCLTFENPCISQDYRCEGIEISKSKYFNQPFIFCFAGRLEDEKGVRRIIEAFKLLNDKDKEKVKEVHFIGNGPNMDVYKSLAHGFNINFIFHGFLKFDDLFEIFKKSHFFLLPSSASEGFPKVIAEALNFGCIPIVSNVSSIGQYIHEGKNGFITTPNTSENLKNVIEGIQKLRHEDLKTMQSDSDLIDLFTYDYYLERIKNEII